MHYASHILIRCIAVYSVINGGKAARNAVSPDILANFAKNVASVLSPAILGEIQSRNNRSSYQSILTIPVSLNDDDLNSPSTLNNIVERTSNGRKYYGSRSYPYNGLYEDSVKRLEGSEANERFEGSLRHDSYLRQERPNFYKSYDFPASNGNIEITSKSTDRNIEPSIGNIEESPTNLYSSYHGAGFPKAAFPHGPFLAKPYAGFHGFGPYGHFHGHHGHHGHYGHHGHHGHPYGGEPPSDNDEAAPENNGTNHRGYGSPYFDHGFHQPYSPFPYGGHGDSFYGPYRRNGNSSENGRNGNHGYGPYHGGPDFYGPHGYGHGYGYNGNNNGNDNNNRQTEEPAENGNQNNSTKNGYPHPYGPPLVKPLLGAFHLHGFPSPFNLLPYDHFHGLFKGGPVVGVGHVGYPIYADPYPIGFPFHHPYGPFFHGKKYLPPKGKPSDSGESTEAPAGELSENENPERITTLNEEEVAPASSSNRYKTSERKGLKRISLVNFEPGRSDSRKY